MKLKVKKKRGYFILIIIVNEGTLSVGLLSANSKGFVFEETILRCCQFYTFPCFVRFAIVIDLPGECGFI